MPVPAVHCEAKLHAFRKTQEGVVVSFVIHPAQIPERVALDPLGTRYMLVLAAIGDDETAVPPAEQYISTNVFDGTRPVPKEHADRLREKAQARYHSQTEMEKAVTRAAMLCQDRGFAVWLTGDPLTPVQVASVLREACGVTSRSDIATDVDAYNKYIKIETEYQIHSGRMAQPR